MEIKSVKEKVDLKEKIELIKAIANPLHELLSAGVVPIPSVENGVVKYRFVDSDFSVDLGEYRWKLLKNNKIVSELSLISDEENE